jgi:hypothetical protein
MCRKIISYWVISVEVTFWTIFRVWQMLVTRCYFATWSLNLINLKLEALYISYLSLILHTKFYCYCTFSCWSKFVCLYVAWSTCSHMWNLVKLNIEPAVYYRFSSYLCTLFAVILFMCVKKINWITPLHMEVTALWISFHLIF